MRRAKGIQTRARRTEREVKWVATVGRKSAVNFNTPLVEGSCTGERVQLAVDVQSKFQRRNMEFATKGPLMVITTPMNHKMPVRWKYSMGLRDTARTHEMEFHLLFRLLQGHERGFLQMYYESKDICKRGI